MTNLGFVETDQKVFLYKKIVCKEIVQNEIQGILNYKIIIILW